ncbi:hypothetical protein SAMN05216188_11561 [Lentzea xinjiangensis]|uniref:PDZ domain-containing protein n=1 Tax=Lentzea xinjiangensis TaxID=402600 RepID=A0A1H9RUQ3_9PSEU|nr:hypothetical protein [Lentzea xinjiangensis]SER76288.1 hypothetical protein SAMN05216188_11561 [Lentzea xinjiangensis]
MNNEQARRTAVAVIAVIAAVALVVALVAGCTPGTGVDDRPKSAPLVQFHETQVSTVEDLLGALRPTEPGQQVTMTVVRTGQRHELEATTAARTR